MEKVAKIFLKLLLVVFLITIIILTWVADSNNDFMIRIIITEIILIISCFWYLIINEKI